MDKVMKVEIEKILEEMCTRIDIYGDWRKQFDVATSSLTSLIIKWLEKADICDECKNKLLTNLTDRI
jgi:hypothetical protein